MNFTLKHAFFIQNRIKTKKIRCLQLLNCQFKAKIIDNALIISWSNYEICI